MRRRPWLTSAIAGFTVANLITALSPSYPLTIVARFVAGISAGLLWALLAGYAARMASEAQKGRAIAVAMAGTPLALSVGIPAATFLGTIIGWRTCFALITAAAVLLAIWIVTRLPDFPGQTSSDEVPLITVGRLPGVCSVLAVTLSFVLAHNILFTYIVPLLHPAEMHGFADVILLLFGCWSLASIWFVGIFIDRMIWALAVASCLTFIGAVIMPGIWPGSRAAMYLAIVFWGFAFGGAATISQTAMTRVTPQQNDIAQSMLVTVWSLAIAGGGIIGGALLKRFGIAIFPAAMLILLFPCGFTVLASRRNAFG